VDAGGGGLLVALAVAGLASGVHCLGMCGGIVGAFAARPHGAALPSRRGVEFTRQLAFNAGRICSYAIGGAIAGSVGGLAIHFGALPAQQALQIVANAMLVLVGLHLMGATQWLSGLEALGGPLWRRLQPIAARALTAQTLPQAWIAGLAWGWLPCGLVYGALAGAAFAGSAFGGALAMLAFGFGTLPNLLAAGLVATQLRRWFALRAVRFGAGAIVGAFGVAGLLFAGGLAESLRRGLLSD